MNPDTQQGTLVQGFTYSSTASPTVSSVSPATGSVGVAQSVGITGTNFVAGASVAVGPYDATGVTVNGATSITAIFPAMPSGNYNVVVTNPSGQAGTKFAAYAIPVVVDSSTVTVTSPNGGESWGAGTKPRHHLDPDRRHHRPHRPLQGRVVRPGHRHRPGARPAGPTPGPSRQGSRRGPTTR